MTEFVTPPSLEIIVQEIKTAREVEIKAYATILENIKKGLKSHPEITSNWVEYGKLYRMRHEGPVEEIVAREARLKELGDFGNNLPTETERSFWSLLKHYDKNGTMAVTIENH